MRAMTGWIQGQGFSWWLHTGLLASTRDVMPHVDVTEFGVAEGRYSDHYLIGYALGSSIGRLVDVIYEHPGRGPLT
jgi:hypothetical protein